MKKYRIGQLARMMCVSLDFIRFYEEKGLIKYTADPKNRYHYYDISQSEMIHKIQQYRKLGYNVNETVALLRHADKNEMIELFLSRSAAHQNSIKMSSYAIRYLYFLQATLSTPSGTWYISRKPAMWFLPHTIDENYLDDPATLSAYKEWNEQLPLVFSLDKWILNRDGTLHQIQHGRGIEQSVADDFGLNPTSPAMLYPEKRCMEYYLDLENQADTGWAPTMELSSIHEAMDVVREKQFEIDGDVFVRHVTFYHTGEIRHNIFVIYVPIK